MHLVFLTAFQDEPFGPAVDRKREAALLKSAILLALETAAISADVGVGFSEIEVGANIRTSDADATFAAVAPVLRASPFCRNGYVLIRYGAPGAPERQVSLAEPADKASLD